MNPKFFDVKKEKQDAIINAALMVFAENGYKKASTDNIVKAAGISKGLLFHYFISKQGVYEFIYDYSIKYTMIELSQTINKKETDFFAIQRMIELTKLRVMKNYPYMQQFLNNVKYETHPDALKIINESGNDVDEAYAAIYKRADMSKFNRPVDATKIIRMIGWMSDGFIRDKFRNGTPEPDSMNGEFAQYLSMLREHFYGSSAGNSELVIETPEVVRDDSVMDSMKIELVGESSTAGSAPASKNTGSGKKEIKKSAPAPKVIMPELSFEERLALGKKSAYYQEPEKPAKEEKPVIEEEPAAVEIPVNKEVAESAIAAADITEVQETVQVPEIKESAAETGTDIAGKNAEEAGTVETADKEESTEASAEGGAAADEPAESSVEDTANAETDSKSEDIEDTVSGSADAAEVEAASDKEEDSVEAEVAEASDKPEDKDVTETSEEPEISAEPDAPSEEPVQEKAEEPGKTEETPVKTKEADKDKAEAADKAEAKAKTEETEKKASSKKDEVTISVETFDKRYSSRSRDRIRTSPYATTATVALFLPDTDLGFFKDSRLGDFSYGSDERGGRGIPYDSSENIQIFVADEDEEEDDFDDDDYTVDMADPGYAEESSQADEDDPDDGKKTEAASETETKKEIDLDDLSEKIMINTHKEAEEQERVKELESMGPAPVLPDFDPSNINTGSESVDEDNEDVHIYRPLSF